MARLTRLHIAAIGCFAASAALAWIVTGPLEPTEFSGGTLTGPLLLLARIGGWFFLISVPVLIWRPRLSSVLAALACGLALPLYLYLIVPLPFQWLTNGEFSVRRSFVWNSGAIAGIASLAISLYVARRILGSLR